jgi:acyl-CoA synthetase (AMP-forming)/AMP-acid ligase II
MEGYLNAPQPFDADGWYDTGDVAEEHDGYLRIAGRKSDIINVGGEKVFPAEVESVLLQMPNVVDAVVEGRHNAVMGQVVTARVNLETPELRDGFETRMRRFCSSRLAEFKLPVFVEVTAEPLRSSRFKRQRSPAVER